CVLPRFRNGRGICARRHDGAGGGNLGGECAAGDSGTGLASADGADELKKAQARARLQRAANGNGESNGERTAFDLPGPVSSMFPRLMDIYLLRRFFFHFIILLAIFVFLFETFTFFELLDSIARNRIAFLTVVKYFWYLTPYLLYNLAPLGALVGVLVTLGVMSKNNEIVAIKASGTSLYRLAMPL